MPVKQDYRHKDDPTRGKGKRSRYAATTNGSLGTDMLVSGQSASEVVSTINAVIALGDAIMFSRTSGGGILCIAVYSAGYEPEKFYCRDEASLDIVLADIENAAKDDKASQGL